MAKTADVLQAIWADPWFVALPPDAKLIFLWAITNEHANLAGLYVVAEETIRHETKFSSARLAKALEQVRPTMAYVPELGIVCVPSRPKHVRSKTEQIRKSIVAAVRDCPVPEIQSHYVERYRKSAWLGEALQDLALEVGIGEPRQTSVNLAEVPSQSHSQRSKEKQQQQSTEWSEWLSHFHEATGKTSTTGSAAARRLFLARRSEGRSLDDLKLATVGCHADEHLRAQGFDRPETILQDSKVERYIELGKKVGKPKRDPVLERMAARAA